MPRGIYELLKYILVAILLAGLTTGVFAQTPDSNTQYFPETNHNISGEFLTFYRSLKNPYQILGYPISEAMPDNVTQILVQYFQLGRLELHTDAPADSQVFISDLGSLVYTPGAPLANFPNEGPSCRYFQTTGKNVCYAFLEFYEHNNGAVYFGNPISQIEIHDGRYVQYFEKTRMEWRPEVTSGQRIGLTALGTLYYELRERGNNTALSIIGQGSAKVLRVRAFVGHSLVPANSQQTLYIIVQDQGFNPVAQAAAGVTVILPDGKQQIFRLADTNESGISTLNFTVGQVDPQQLIRIEATVSQGVSEQKASASFRIWY
jgi:hypothetical protein